MSDAAAPRRATLSDVAREAGVSTSTASVVFSRKASVSDVTRDRVLEAAALLGYTGPDPMAASLRRGRSGIVAIVLDDSLRAAFLDPVTIPMMDGIADGLASLGAGMLLIRDEPDEDGASALTTAPIDAAILIGWSDRTRGSLEIVRGRGIPLVVIEGHAGDGIPRVALDNREAAAEITRHVRDLGHRNVVAVTLPLDNRRMRGEVTQERLERATVEVATDRLAGLREVLPDAPAYAAAASSIDEGLIAGRKLLSDPEHRPTAVLAQSDLLAVGVIRAAEELGLRVPADVSVAGFDGIRVDGKGDYVLTTMVQPAAQKGRAAGEQIVRMLRGEPVESMHLTCRFRAGNTTAAPAIITERETKAASAG